MPKKNGKGPFGKGALTGKCKGFCAELYENIAFKEHIMKICLPVNGENGLTEMVYNHFGSAPYFAIADTESGFLLTAKNNKAHHSHGTCQPLDVISVHKIDVIITNGIGRRAIQMLNNTGIKVYASPAGTVENALKLFKEGKLVETCPENSCGGHGHGHGHGCH